MAMSKGIKLGHMQVDDISFTDEFPGLGGQPRHDHTFADLESNRHADDPDTFQRFGQRQGGVILRGQDRHLVLAGCQGARQPLDIDRQTGFMRVIIS